MAGQPNQASRCRRLAPCALLALVWLCGSLSVAQPPPEGPLLMPGNAPPPGAQMQSNEPPQGAYGPALNTAPPAAAGYPLPGSPGFAQPGAVPPGSFLPGAAPPGAAPPGVPPANRGPYNLPPEDTVMEVRVEGNRTVATSKVMAVIHTRATRPYSEQTVQDDVRALSKMGVFVYVKPETQRVPGGVAVVFRVAERPLLADVIVIGNDTYKTSVLKKEAELKPGDAADPYAVEAGRRKIEEYYQKNGFPKVRVTILEGNKPGDLRVVFMVDEGPHQKVFWINFVGNNFVSSQRLKSLIQSHPPYLYLFSGEVDRKQIDEDVKKLTAYYRGFGFFHARIGRELEFNQEQNWLTLTFVIDEGPRYEIRNVSFLGNRRFENGRLNDKLKLLSGQFFDQNQQNIDLQKLRDEYGGEGYVFAKIEADNRFLEEPGKLDIVYTIDEGGRYHVGRINIEIRGENPHTMITTVLNRLSVKPGDIADTREIRASERRLKAAQIYKVEPAKGVEPKIAYSPPESDDTMLANRRQTTYYRYGGPLPPLPPGEGYLDLDVSGVPEEYSDRLPSPPPTYQGQTYQGQSYQGQTSPAPAAPAYNTQAPAGPVVYEARFQTADGYYPPPPAGQSWTPTGQYNGNAYAAPPPQPYVPQQPYYNGPVQQPSAPMFYNPPPQQNAGPGQYQYAGAAPASGFSPAGAYGANPGYGPAPQPNYGAPNGTSPAYNYGPPQSAVAPPGGAIYSPAGPASDRPVAQMANGGDLIADPSPMMFPPNNSGDDYRALPLQINPEETQTGRLMFGVGVNSDAGLVGNITIDEQNFSWRNVPESWEDVEDGRAFRGEGERFRLELVPGTQVQRYMVTYQDPYLDNQPVSFGLSGFFYERIYTEWTEQRVGGSVSLGYQFTHDLTGTLRFQGQNVKIENPEYPVPTLTDVVGHSQLYTFSASLQHDTRDNPFNATEGHLMSATMEETVGTFQYPRASIEFSQFYKIFQRADRSGNHVLNLQFRAGYTGDDTPIFERYYDGGFSTIRGFAFRGVTPRDPVYGMGVGGDFQATATAQYLFPITADDMLKGVLFVDAGTVEPTITNWIDTTRVAPGLGLRISIPAMGPAPIALDFAFPINKQPGDVTQVFSFFVGLNH